MHPEALDLEAGRPKNDGERSDPSFEDDQDDRPSTPSGVYTAEREFATQREAVAVQLDVALRRRDEVEPFGPPEILAMADLAAQNPASSVRGIPLHLATGPNQMAMDNLLRTINWDY